MTIDSTLPSQTQVTTIPAAVVPTGFIQITARTRSVTDKTTGKKTEIPLHARSRSILIPEFSIDAPSKFVRLICNALEEIARQQLDAAWEANPGLLTVDTAAYSLDSLLLYAAREAESKKLNGASILAWWEQSELKRSMQQRYSAAQLARFAASLENIAAPTLSAEHYNEDKALKRIVTLATHEADSEHPLVIQMIAKLQRYVDKLRATRDAIGSIEEIDA
jgi:hypothetical protein